MQVDGIANGLRNSYVRHSGASPGFGCRVRTEPVSDTNPNLRRPIRSGSESRSAKPIRIRTQGGNRSEPEHPPNASHLIQAGPYPFLVTTCQFGEHLVTETSSRIHSCSSAAFLCSCMVNPRARICSHFWVYMYPWICYITSSLEAGLLIHCCVL